MTLSQQPCKKPICYRGAGSVSWFFPPCGFPETDQPRIEGITSRWSASIVVGHLLTFLP